MEKYFLVFCLYGHINLFHFEQQNTKMCILIAMSIGDTLIIAGTGPDSEVRTAICLAG